MTKEIKPAGDIVREMMDEAERVVKTRLVALVDGVR